MNIGRRSINRILVGLILVGSSGIMVIALRGRLSPMWTTAIIFLIAFCCLSVVALKRSTARSWLYVDYPWICATVVSVFIAIAVNTTSVNYAKLVEARQLFRASISDTLFTLDGNIDRNCREADVNSSDCKRNRHLLYQAQQAYRAETIRGVESPDFPNNWASEFCVKLPVPEHVDVYTENDEQCKPKHDFDGAQQTITDAINVYERDRGFLDTATKDGRLRYWYYFYAALAALRLSRVTADLKSRRSLTVCN